MATGFSRTLEGGHDVIYDYCCTTCEGENLNAEAQYYCKDCSQLFCEPCKKYHDKFFRTHQGLDRKDVAKLGDVKPANMSLMCDEHPGKKLKMFCEKHDRLCCSICMDVKHRGCKNVKPVSDMAKGIKKKSGFKSILSKAPKIQSLLKTLHDKQQNNIKMLQKAREEITSTLKNLRKKLNQIVDKLEEDSATGLDRLLTMLKEQIMSNKDACLDIHDKIEKHLADIQTLGKDCDELAFQAYKKCSEQMAGAGKLVSFMQNEDYQFKFVPDVNIEQYLSSLKTLGSFQVTSSGCVNQPKTDEVAQTITQPDHAYSVVNKQTYNVKTSGDTAKCCITGICQLPNKQTAIVDFANSKVKLLSASTYTVKDELELPTYPRDICHTTGLELAVTVREKEGSDCIRKEIHFINAGSGNLLHIRTVQLDHTCGGIAYNRGQLYVASKDALYVYNLSGKKMKQLYQDTSGEYPGLSRFSFSNDGSMIYVTNCCKNVLIILDSSGNKFSTLSGPELKGTTGVCVADNGSVFVCGKDSGTVIQVDRGGRRRITTLVTLDKDFGPLTLFYDRRTLTLLVGLWENDNLLALQLK